MGYGGGQGGTLVPPRPGPARYYGAVANRTNDVTRQVFYKVVAIIPCAPPAREDVGKFLISLSYLSGFQSPIFSCQETFWCETNPMGP